MCICLFVCPTYEASAAMIVPSPIRLKFGREMGNYPGRSMHMFGLGTPTHGCLELYVPVRLDVAVSFAAGSGFAQEPQESKLGY